VGHTIAIKLVRHVLLVRVRSHAVVTRLGLVHKFHDDVVADSLDAPVTPLLKRIG
jgi:hypothetical protein